MAHRRSIISLQLAVTFAASIFMFAAEAIQLGDIRAHSALGESLDATVGVWLTTKDRTQPLRLKISPDIAYRANPNLTALVAGINAELLTTANGASYIPVPVTEWIVALLFLFLGNDAVQQSQK